VPKIQVIRLKSEFYEVINPASCDPRAALNYKERRGNLTLRSKAISTLTDFQNFSVIITFNSKTNVSVLSCC